MKIKYIVFSCLALITSISFGADAISIEQCAAMKDATKRINCYDAAAKPSSGKQRKESAGRESKIRTDRSISVEAGLVYKAGNVTPVARTVFYVLDASFSDILRKANIELPFDSGKDNPSYFEVLYPSMSVDLFGFASAQMEKIKRASSSPTTEKMIKFYEDSIAAMAPHIIGKETTDFGGKARFSQLRPSTYYVFGVYAAPNNSLAWNVKVNASDSDTKVTLDQNNAEISSTK
jgi:hypothetical protein